MSIKRIAIVVTLITFLFSLSIFNAGCSAVADFTESLNPQQKTSKWSDELPPDFDLLVDAWKVVSQNYVDKDKLDPKKLSQGAIKGMIEALNDPPSFYVDPQIRKLEVGSLTGRYFGIGAYVGLKDKQLTIIAPMAGSPAEEAGIKAGDKILEIDGKNTEGMSPTEAALTIQGPSGTTVKLLLFRDGEAKPFEKSIVRREITIKSVSSEKKGNIGYIKLTQFMQQSDSELIAALKPLIAEGVDGIVLDLRNNPGGLLNTAVSIASQFISSGVVVDVVDSENNHKQEMVRNGGVALNVPLIVLVNKGSASASEVLAGALQDHNRAKVAGTVTYGKGSVQMITGLKEGSALHLTIARWYTPNDRPIDGIGLQPDIPLELEGDDLVNWAVDYLNNQKAAK